MISMMLPVTSWMREMTSLKALAASGDNFKISTTSSTVMMFKASITTKIENAVEAKIKIVRKVRKEMKSGIFGKKLEVKRAR